MTRSPGCAQRKQCRHGNPFGESGITTPWSGAPAAATRRAASATSVASGTIWKFKVFMSTAKCIASIRASTKFGQGILCKERRFLNRRGRLGKRPSLSSAMICGMAVVHRDESFPIGCTNLQRCRRDYFLSSSSFALTADSISSYKARSFLRTSFAASRPWASCVPL